MIHIPNAEAARPWPVVVGLIRAALPYLIPGAGQWAIREDGALVARMETKVRRATLSWLISRAVTGSGQSLQVFTTAMENVGSELGLGRDWPTDLPEERLRFFLDILEERLVEGAKVEARGWETPSWGDILWETAPTMPPFPGGDEREEEEEEDEDEDEEEDEDEDPRDDDR